MANITKKVNLLTPSNQRYQYWSSTENADNGSPMAQGDVFRFTDSLGKAAKNIVIQAAAGSDLQIRLNNRQRRAQRHKQTQIFNPGIDGSFYDNLSTLEEITDTTMAVIPIGAVTANTFSLDGGMTVDNMEITTWTTGTFTVLIS